MVIKVEHTFVRPPNSDIIEDGSWWWSACWHNSLRPGSWDEHDYVIVHAGDPWEAVGLLTVKLEELFA